MDNPSKIEPTIEFGLFGNKAQNPKNSMRVIKSGLVFIVSAGLGLASNNSLPINPQSYIKKYDHEYNNYQNPNNVSYLGTYSGAIETMDINSKEDEDFEFSVIAMDKLSDLEIVPAKNHQTIKIDSIKHVPSKVIEPDIDDFYFSLDIED